MAHAQDPGCRLYLITPPAIDLKVFPDLLARTLDAGDVAALQLRLKPADPDTIRAAVAAIRDIAQSRGVALLLNDRPDLAVALGCDGAHVGQEDMEAGMARRILGDLMLGVTCHNSRDLAMTAGEAGADYVAFGAFFPTATKEVTTLADPAVLTWWSELMELPSVAIGGITAGNAGALVTAGADFLAVMGAVWHHPEGPEAGVRAINAAIAAVA